METAPSFSIFIYFTFYLFIHLENAIGGVGRSLSFALFSLHHKYIAPKSFLLYGVTVIVTINVYHHQQLTTILIFYRNNSISINLWALMQGPNNQDLFFSQLPSPLNLWHGKKILRRLLKRLSYLLAINSNLWEICSLKIKHLITCDLWGCEK